MAAKPPWAGAYSMTIQIDANVKIAGVPILEVRDLPRRYQRGFHFHDLETTGRRRNQRSD